MPEVLADGIIYVSVRFSTAVHRCCCGCGVEVATPISPADWQLTFDGESVSLYPSIGNWSLACKSHYWIRRNQVVWARRWSAKEIEEGRTQDRLAINDYFAEAGDRAVRAPATPAPIPKGSLWRRLRRLWS
jgi:Family of unknown function (DUF6527)